MYAHGGVIPGGGGDPIRYVPTPGEKVFMPDGRVLEWQLCEDEDAMRLVLLGSWSQEAMDAMDVLNRGEA